MYVQIDMHTATLISLNKPPGYDIIFYYSRFISFWTAKQDYSYSHHKSICTFLPSRGCTVAKKIRFIGA
uniref:Uncharacterized protein n=1 Tax=Anguilla anguilla TaxID=7936 RepID=A0A0E9UYA2_ANGAN